MEVFSNTVSTALLSAFFGDFKILPWSIKIPKLMLHGSIQKEYLEGLSMPFLNLRFPKKFSTTMEVFFVDVFKYDFKKIQ